MTVIVLVSVNENACGGGRLPTFPENENEDESSEATFTSTAFEVPSSLQLGSHVSASASASGSVSHSVPRILLSSFLPLLSRCILPLAANAARSQSEPLDPRGPSHSRSVSRYPPSRSVSDLSL
jgi:hypothetical protein